MSSIAQDTALKDYQKFTKEVYEMPNERHFSVHDMLINIQRFTMRGLKGVRKDDVKKSKINFLIALSWFISFLNRLHIDLENEVWSRFPYCCSYCTTCPCSCNEFKIMVRKQISAPDARKPKSLEGFQLMFNEIYPASKRTLEHSAVHLAEELGELSEAILIYLGTHKDKDFEKVKNESADFFSCLVGAFNSLDINISKELSFMFADGCHECKKTPCECDFEKIATFKS